MYIYPAALPGAHDWVDQALIFDVHLYPSQFTRVSHLC